MNRGGELRTGISIGVVLMALYAWAPPASAQTGTASPPAPPATGPVIVTVAADGSAQFTTIQAAVMSVPSGSPAAPVIIRIKPGTYRELIYIQHEKRYFRLIGEDAATTIISFDLHANMTGLDGKPIGTFRTPTVVVDADDFEAEHLTFENGAGPVGQALALRLDSDRAIFRDCRFLGWQDTLFLNRGRVYFDRCFITGHVDFIFGAAAAYFDDCQIHVRRDGYITAASTQVDQPYGFVFRRARITGEPGVKTYLGRPWRDYSATIFVDSEMSAVVRPEGWQNWNLPAREKTARYAEAGSRGDGGAPEGRVAWAKRLSASEAKALTPKAVLGGADGWNPVR
jgi:pectinesterase